MGCVSNTFIYDGEIWSVSTFASVLGSVFSIAISLEEDVVELDGCSEFSVVEEFFTVVVVDGIVSCVGTLDERKDEECSLGSE
ncbi:hypothetical protein D3X11_02285 [Streptococcus sp. X16XC17]|nr:hypothetical protein D3X11_02285 [Streptococcus sp. X16XC17]